ncbi:NAD-glutamate dehydrogenase [bacterium]|nr:NAD-glutamate dehydrogenase [bacterium]
MSKIKKIREENTLVQDDSDNSVFDQFITHFLRGMSERMRETYSNSELEVFLKDRFAFFRKAVSRSGMVQVVPHKLPSNTHEESYFAGNVIIEIVSPDAPFIVVTVEALLRQLDLMIHRKLHPIMGVRLTAEKEILGVISPVDTSEKFDHLYLEIDADADIVSLKRIENLIAGHMLAVQLVQNQRQNMLKRLESMEKEIDTVTVISSDTKEEWSKLCGWLKLDNFTLMGFITLVAQDSDSTNFIKTIDNSGLGILAETFLAKSSKTLLNVVTARLSKRRHSEFPFALDLIRFTSPVLRFENLMMLSIRVPDKKSGMVEHVFLGLLRGSSLQVKNVETPLIHQKMDYIFKNRNMLVNSYDYNEVVRIFRATPKFELFRSSRKELIQVCDGLLSVNNPNNIYCFQINTRVTGVLKLMIVMPTSLFSEEAIGHTVVLVKAIIPHQHCDWFEARGSEKSRLHLEFELQEDTLGKSELPNVDLLQLENEISGLIKPWKIQLRELLQSKNTGDEGARLYERYVPLMPSHYSARVEILEALENIQFMELLTRDDDLQFDLKHFSIPSELG